MLDVARDRDLAALEIAEEELRSIDRLAEVLALRRTEVEGRRESIRRRLGDGAADRKAA